VAIDKELLDILACPKCKSPVVLNRAGDALLCQSCRLLYEIEDDIPIMLIDEAKPFDDVPSLRLETKGSKGRRKTAKKASKKKSAKKTARKTAKKAAGKARKTGARSRG